MWYRPFGVAGHDVLQDAAGRNMEEDVVHDDGRHAGLPGHRRQLMKPERIVRTPPQRQRQIGAIAEGLAQPAEAQRAGVVLDRANMRFDLERGREANDGGIGTSDDSESLTLRDALATGFYADNLVDL